MPITFHVPDPETGEFRPVEHFTVTETAKLLHTSRDWVRKQCDLGVFPHLRVHHRYYFTAAHIARIHEVMTWDGLAVIADELDPPPPRLGVVIEDPDDIEGVR